jgi:hypothetical protein
MRGTRPQFLSHGSKSSAPYAAQLIAAIARHFQVRFCAQRMQFFRWQRQHAH